MHCRPINMIIVCCFSILLISILTHFFLQFLGMIYGEFKVCTFDACYYCFECHENEEHVIPGRVIHNWDLRKHQVSKQCKLFLLHIEEEPLFNIDETNPTLYNVIKELHEVKVSAEFLSFSRKINLVNQVQSCTCSLLIISMKQIIIFSQQ